MTSIKERLRRDSSADEHAPAADANGNGAGGGAGGNGHRDLDLRELRPPQTTADRLRPFGRVALWVVLAIIFARGLSQILNPTEPVVEGDAAATSDWPNAAAGAFALDFARTYFSFSGDGEPQKLTEQYNATVERFLTPELRGDIAQQAVLPGEGIQQLYYSGEVVGAETMDSDHAVLTVEALIQQDVPGSKDVAAFSGQKRIFLTVPIGRDDSGNLALFAHPSLVAAAPTGSPSILDTADVDDPGARDISDLSERFLGDYLSGVEAGKLKFYLAPGTQLPPLEGGYRLVTPLQSVEQIGEGSDTARSLVVTANVLDQTTNVKYTWQYLIDVVQRDRWYVTRIEGGPGEAAVTISDVAAADDSAAGTGGSTTTTTSEPTGSG